MADLAILFDEVREAIRESYQPGCPYNDNLAHEAADSAVPVYNADLLELVSEAEVQNWEPELGPAYDGAANLVNITAGVVYEILSQQASLEVERCDNVAEDWREGSCRDRWDLRNEFAPHLSVWVVRSSDCPKAVIEGLE